MNGKLLNYKYNIYGSADSTDTDAVVFLDTLPEVTEDRKNLTNAIKKECGVDWNLIIATAANGVITDCTNKSSPDSLNNALLNTYSLHQQEWQPEVLFHVERNIPLAIYKTIRLILSYLSRTQYRSLLRPTMHFSFGIDVKLDQLLQVDYNEIKSLNQQNVSDTDAYKSIVFYIAQNIALLEGNELYSKKTICDYEPKAYPFIYRLNDQQDMVWLTQYMHHYVKIIKSLGVICDKELIKYHNQVANMKSLTA